MLDQQSDKIDKLIPALVAARKEITGAIKSADSHFGKYADLCEIITCSNSALLDQDIFLSQSQSPLEGIDYVVTQVSHISGQYLRSFTKIVNGKPNDPQAHGSAISYARRYGYEAMLNIQRLDENSQPMDDDANKAMPDKSIAGVDFSKPNYPKIIKTAQAGERKITKAQAGLIWHKFKDSGFSEAQTREYLMLHYGVKSNFDVPILGVKAILTAFDNGELLPIEVAPVEDQTENKAMNQNQIMQEDFSNEDEPTQEQLDAEDIPF